MAKSEFCDLLKELGVEWKIQCRPVSQLADGAGAVYLMLKLIALLKDKKIDYLLVFVLFFTLGIFWEYNLVFGDPDGFYHVKIAQFIAQGHILTSLPWMQFSTLRDHFTDHHFLYHVFLVPFIVLGKPLLGAKLATAFLIGLFFTVFYRFLKFLDSAAPFWFTVLLGVNSALTFRLGLIKANSLSLIIFFLIFAALMQRQWWLVFLLNFIYVWSYGGWPLGWVLAGLYVVIFHIYHRHKGRERHWYNFFRRNVLETRSAVPALFSTLAGSVAGIIINPYFPHNLYFYWQQIWQIAIVNLGGTLSVGGEWSSLAPREFFVFFGFSTIILAIGLSSVLFSIRQIQFRTWISLVLFILFFAFTIKSRRYIELSAPLAVVFAACAWSDIYPKNLVMEIMHSWHPRRRWAKEQIGFTAFVACFVFFFLPNLGPWSQVLQTHAQLKEGITFKKYEAASQWLQNHTPLHSIVLHSDWDDWPMLFYHNDHNYYVVGLDPRFMYDYNPSLHTAWANLTRDGKVDDAYALVTKDLHASYILIEKDHTAMQQVFAKNIYFRLMYEDTDAWIYAPV